MTRLQNILPSALLLLLGLVVLRLSYGHQEYEAAAFVFPKLVVWLFVGLAVWSLLVAILKGDSDNEGFTLSELLNLLPGLMIAVAYIFWGAKFFGFYTGTTIFFFMLLTYYDPAPHSAVWSWVKRVLITAGFIAVMYCLFALILNVYTPREIFS